MLPGNRSKTCKASHPTFSVGGAPPVSTGAVPAQYPSRRYPILSGHEGGGVWVFELRLSDSSLKPGGEGNGGRGGRLLVFLSLGILF